VWLSSASVPDPALAETVLASGPMLVALPSDHPLTRLRELDAEALAATPRLCDWQVQSLASRLALVAAGEGYALVPSLAAELHSSGVAVRPLAGAGEWQLRAARPAAAVPSVGTLAAIEALRAAATRQRLSSPSTATLVAHA
jgi:DNA-binding transcriptional LysR family regulator